MAATWWVGSANLGEAAWLGRNVELMVELDGKRKIRRGEAVGASIDAFLDAGFRNLLTPYVRTERSPEAIAKEKAIDRADEVREELTRAGLTLRADGAGDQFDLALRGGFDLPADVRATVWPVTLNEATHARTFIKGSITWPALAAASLTSMIGFAVTAKYEGATATVRFAIKLDANGFPEDRHARIVRQIIDSQDGFFRCLRMLLSADDDPFDRGSRKAGTAADGAGALRFLTGDAVLEDLLRTLSREPERLDAVDRLIRDLSETEEGRALIPEEFMTLWTTLRTVHGGPS
jgi:hypothetical protein